MWCRCAKITQTSALIKDNRKSPCLEAVATCYCAELTWGPKHNDFNRKLFNWCYLTWHWTMIPPFITYLQLVDGIVISTVVSKSLLMWSMLVNYAVKPWQYDILFDNIEISSESRELLERSVSTYAHRIVSISKTSKSRQLYIGWVWEEGIYCDQYTRKIRAHWHSIWI